MRIFEKAAELTAFNATLKKQGKTIGFIPTMGALHQGHLSLIEASNTECDITVCSVFVNPTQFDKEVDLVKYPRTFEADRKILEEANCDILFFPSVAEIYPDGTDKYIAPAIGEIVNVQEGKHRIGHFEGMMQVVERLLRITTPHNIYMGLKDYQQYLIVKKMAKARAIDVRVKGMPIIRERNGLAMSSRNTRLTENGKNNVALELSRILKLTKELLPDYNIQELEGIGKYLFSKNEKITLEYFEVVDKNTLFSPEDNLQKDNLIALTAGWVDGVRLLDNLAL